MEELIILLILGGPEDSMKKRIETLKLEDGRFYATGFEGEVSFIKGVLGLDDADEVYYGDSLSHDTRSNFINSLVMLQRATKIVVATGPIHMKRIQLTLKDEYLLSGWFRPFLSKEKQEESEQLKALLQRIVWVNSREKEGWTAHLTLEVCKCFGSRFLQTLSKVTRFKRWIAEYMLPSIGRGLSWWVSRPPH